MNAIKRFGSAMIVPVLMFAFFGIVLGQKSTIMGGQISIHSGSNSGQ